MTNSERVFSFLDNCIGNGYGKFPLLRRKYFSSAVNVLINSPEISKITNTDIFELNFSQNDEKYDKSGGMHISVFGAL